MILTGKNIRAKKAGQLGLVHEVVHPSIVRTVAVQRARDLVAGTRKRNANVRARTAMTLLLDDNPLGRSLVLRQARERTMAKTRGHYPAPLAALEAVAAGYQSAEAGYAEEARRFGELAMSPECRELVSLFFATTALKKDSGTPVPAPAARIAKLGMLGAGFMGAGIASVAVRSGVIVRLKDADLARVGHGISALHGVLTESVKRRQLTPQQMSEALLLAGGTADYAGFANADCVIEAVFEDLHVKHAVLREVEAVLPPHAIFASNTSTIPIARIAEASRRPERVLGMHFFSPVHKMPLVEVIVTPRTAHEVTATAVAFGKQLGKTVIVVNDAPGFFVNRILSPYLNEAGRLLDLGASIDAIDSALLAFGFPVGPITLLDEVGLDIAGKSGAIFHEAFGDRMAPSVSLRRVVEAGRLGRKGKLGFYSYDGDGKKGEVDQTVYALLPTGGARNEFAAEEIRRRCVLAMVNEAVRCLEEGIVRSPRDGDIGAVFGIGFPPFRGGPFRYIDALGAGAILAQLEDLEGRFPGRFAPAELLVQYARRNEHFRPA
jgi:3-hydroxyacyl-CoA dehydrogenase/enoyl-CoA hydratase/3-hydroxybutyryl-CoA epimerase